MFNTQEGNSKMKVIQHISNRATRGKNLTLFYGMHNFSVGKILVALTAEGICWFGINCKVKDLHEDWKRAKIIKDTSTTATVALEIAKRWPDTLDKLSIPIVLYGTEFQIKVWEELLKIKPSTTMTYGQIAKRIGNPQATRAAGSALGKNLISLVVPCHRVIHASSRKSNYRWGIATKEALLNTERKD